MTEHSNQRRVGGGASFASLGEATKATGSALRILDALDDEQFDRMGRLSAQAAASFYQEVGRLPDKAEMRRIVALIARAVLEPDAPNYEVQ